VELARQASASAEAVAAQGFLNENGRPFAATSVKIDVGLKSMGNSLEGPARRAGGSIHGVLSVPRIGACGGPGSGTSLFVLGSIRLITASLRGATADHCYKCNSPCRI
jgi:hypothetical protein